MSRPWSIHTLSGMFSPHVDAGLPDGRWVKAVAEPYSGDKIRAAWWVLTGRAYAFQWPEAGDLEKAVGVEPYVRKPRTGGKQAETVIDIK